jgi:hypothetical protein
VLLLLAELSQLVDRMMIRVRKYREVIVSGALLCFFLYLRLFIGSFMNLTIKRWRFVGPDFWPNWILNFAILITAFLLISSIRDVYLASKGAGSECVEEEPAAEEATCNELGRTLGVVGITFVYLYLIRTIGFIVATIMFGIIYLLFLRERRPLILFSIPTVLVLLIYVVFTKVLTVPLPRGTGIFRTISNFFY